MMQFTYIGALLFSLAGMVVLDRRYALAFFREVRATAIALLTGILVFVIWDILGISLGIFYSGHSAYMTGWYLAPEFPVEELLFLTFLCYFTLIVYRLADKVWSRT